MKCEMYVGVATYFLIIWCTLRSVEMYVGVERWNVCESFELPMSADEMYVGAATYILISLS